LVSDEVLSERKSEELARGEKAFSPKNRERHISTALKAYASMVSSADKGAIRII